MGAKINAKIISDFAELQKALPNILDAYGIKKAHILRNTGMSRATFLSKIKHQSFTVKELESIAKILNQ